ncbi:unnamed protein product [Moneuplotes crassus]|uniref:Uncharacterized protein n=1 Tax=Euplotes crassus TaxID=5936 RepID=A0AAD1YBX3_EUPCR|nr:unnamed protein product [Moneuplotes crassus]
MKMSSGSMTKFLETQVQKTQSNLTKLSKKVEEFEFHNLQFNKVDDVLDKMMCRIKRLQSEKDDTTKKLEDRILFLEEKLACSKSLSTEESQISKDLKNHVEHQLRDFEYKLRSEFESLLSEVSPFSKCNQERPWSSEITSLERKIISILEQQAQDMRVKTSYVEPKESKIDVDKFSNEVNIKFFNLQKELDSLEMKIHGFKSGDGEKDSLCHKLEVDTEDLRNLEDRMDKKIGNLVNNLSNLTQKVATKNKTFESKFETLENTIANSFLMHSKRARNRTVSTRRTRANPKPVAAPKRNFRTRKTSFKRGNKSRESKKFIKTRNKKSIRRSKSRNKQDPIKTTYSHDDYILSDSACDDSRSYKPSIHFATDAVTPQNADKEASLNGFQLDTDSIDHYKSISLLEFDHINDNKLTPSQTEIMNIKEDDKVRREISDIFAEDIRKSNTMSQEISGLEGKNIDSNEGYSAMNIAKYKTDRPSDKERNKPEAFKELKLSIAKQLQSNFSREKTFEIKPNWDKADKENVINHKNITFARTDSNMSSAKSDISEKQPEQISKLEKLYNELSMLQKSMN